MAWCIVLVLLMREIEVNVDHGSFEIFFQSFALRMKKKLVLARDSKKLPSKGKVVNILDTIQFSSLIIVGKKKYILLKLQLLSQIIFFVYFFVNLVPTLGFYNYMHGVYWVHTFNKLKVCITRFRYPAPALYFN